MKIISLDKNEYDYFPLHYHYETDEFYEVERVCQRDKFSVTFTRKRLDAPIIFDNTDTLFQEYWQNPRAFGVEDGGKIVAYLEFDTVEWNSTLVMTQLLVNEECRGKGVGKMLFDFVKDYAKNEGFRIITLETQNTNVPAIDFYLKRGFTFCGTNVFFYSNDDISENEVMVEMAYLLD